MDVEINELSSEVRVLDMRALKSDVIREVLKFIEENEKFLERQDADRRLRDRAGDRPDEVA